MSDFLSEIDKKWNYRPLLAVLAGILFFLFIWSAFSQIDQHVKGIGRIVPSGKLRTVQHLEGGIVQAIKVNEGEHVKEGQELFIIENSKAQSGQKEILVSVDALLIKLSRLDAERQEKSEMDLSDKLRTEHPEIVAAETQLFNARRREFEEKISSYRERARQKALLLDSLVSKKNSLNEELNIAKRQLKINQDLFKVGAVSESRYLDTQSRVKDFETRVAEVINDIPVTQAEQAEALNSLEEVRQRYRAEVGEEIRKTEVEIKQLRERQTTYDDQVSRKVVHSPVNGIVNARYVNTVGGVIQPGATLVDIIPIDEKLVVEGRIKTDDRAQVYPKLPVVAKITAYDYAVYGGIKGELTEVSADSFTDNQNREFYRVRATLDTNSIPKDMIVYPGMTVELSIVSGHVSILHAILKPLLRLRDNAFKEL